MKKKDQQTAMLLGGGAAALLLLGRGGRKLVKTPVGPLATTLDATQVWLDQKRIAIQRFGVAFDKNTKPYPNTPRDYADVVQEFWEQHIAAIFKKAGPDFDPSLISIFTRPIPIGALNEFKANVERYRWQLSLLAIKNFTSPYVDSEIYWDETGKIAAAIMGVGVIPGNWSLIKSSVKEAADEAANAVKGASWWIFKKFAPYLLGGVAAYWAITRSNK